MRFSNSILFGSRLSFTVCVLHSTYITSSCIHPRRAISRIVNLLHSHWCFRVATTTTSSRSPSQTATSSMPFFLAR
ncbi:hypothetical protein DFH29DRAFT_333603 [Suillus ampliporus]|nr:hypothetical protein DFH29DRAFT_333603 [Suillus ampliporus]